MKHSACAKTRDKDRVQQGFALRDAMPGQSIMHPPSPLRFHAALPAMDAGAPQPALQ